MHGLIKIIAVAGTVILGLSGSLMAAEVDLQTKISLQNSLDSYVDSNGVDGQLTLIDVNGQSMTTVYMSSAHPMIVPIGTDRYFLCADGYDEDGNEVKLDFLVLASDGNFQIVDTILNGREEIKAIMKSQ